MAFQSESPIGSDSPSEQLIHIVAEQTKTDPLELPPLYDTLDPDALDALLSKLKNGHIEFEFSGQRVRLQSDGTIHLSKDGLTHARQLE